MDESGRQQLLKIALVAFGVIFLLVYPISIVWPSGWEWGDGYSHYFPMIVGVYATLGVFLIAASRDPAAHRSLIAFTAWSSLVHAGVMAVQAFQDTAERRHFIADIPALILVFVVLLVLMPRRATA